MKLGISKPPSRSLGPEGTRRLDEAAKLSVLTGRAVNEASITGGDSEEILGRMLKIGKDAGEVLRKMSEAEGK